MLSSGWRKRAEIAEAELAKATTALQVASDFMTTMQATHDHHAKLIAINRNGRVVRFTFSRDNQLHNIEMMGTWDDDVDQWQRDLLKG